MWRWIWIFLTLATLKCFLGIAGFVASGLGLIQADASYSLRVFSLMSLLAYLLVGGLLVWAGRRDRRAVYLGAAYLLTASSSSDALFTGFHESGLGVFPAAAAFFNRLQPDAFLPVFIWLFFDEFPRKPSFGLARTLPRRAALLSAIAGCALFAQLAFETRSVSIGLGEDILSLYAWSILLGLSFPALLFALWKTRDAPLDERRRVRLFLAGIAVGLVPALSATFLEIFVPPFARLLQDPHDRLIERLVLRPLLILSPAITAYSVLVNRVLDVKLYLRRAIQYALTRYALLAAATVPFLLLGIYVYKHREQTVSQLLSGSPMILSLVGIGGVIGLQLRSRAGHFIDRRFFREQYDSKRILADLVARSRDARNADELAGLLETGLDRALHLESVAVLSREMRGGELKAHRRGIRPLDEMSNLARFLAGSPEPLGVNLESQGDVIQRLGQDEREWIADGDFCLLVPLLASDGSLVGLIALGEKKSELPYSSEDRLLLIAIAGAAALTLENRLLLSTPALARERAVPSASILPADHGFALECTGCHRLQAGGRSTCAACGGPLAKANIPCVLRGKFRFDRRIGAGAMGIVYEAMDLDLGRKVAIKTLPRVSPEYSRRLRHEARAMAAVSHPNLASIFGAETWRGTPMLVFEYLEGGTLAERLLNERLELIEALELGIALCGALDRLHAAGILHRDIKPSNIGYTLDRAPKLLDLGLAKIRRDTAEVETASRSTVEAPPRMPDAAPDGDQTGTVGGRVVGTLAYLSPQALQGSPPEPRFDLWSLSVVLFEAMAGSHPFMSGSASETLDRILQGKAADLRATVPGCPAAVTALFATLLAFNPGHRPAVASQMRLRLEDARAAL